MIKNLDQNTRKPAYAVVYGTGAVHIAHAPGFPETGNTRPVCGAGQNHKKYMFHGSRFIMSTWLSTEADALDPDIMAGSVAGRVTCKRCLKRAAQDKSTQEYMENIRIQRNQWTDRARTDVDFRKQLVQMAVLTHAEAAQMAVDEDQAEGIEAPQAVQDYITQVKALVPTEDGQLVEQEVTVPAEIGTRIQEGLVGGFSIAAPETVHTIQDDRTPVTYREEFTGVTMIRTTWAAVSEGDFVASAGSIHDEVVPAEDISLVIIAEPSHVTDHRLVVTRNPSFSGRNTRHHNLDHEVLVATLDVRARIWPTPVHCEDCDWSEATDTAADAARLMADHENNTGHMCRS